MKSKNEQSLQPLQKSQMLFNYSFFSFQWWLQNYIHIEILCFLMLIHKISTTKLKNKRSIYVLNTEKLKTKERLEILCNCKSQKLISPLPVFPAKPNLCEYLPSRVVQLLSKSEEAESGNTFPIQI